jgi:TRAP-type C4-dicarboxylate transport system permease small subunit
MAQSFPAEAARVQVATVGSRALRAVKVAGDVVAQICLSVGAAALLATILICGINVARRYLFDDPWGWAEEAMVYLMIVTVFLSCVTVTWEGRHMRLEMVVERLPRAIRPAAAYLAALIAAGTLLMLAVVSFHVVAMLYGFGQQSDTLRLSMWIPQSLVIICFGLSGALIVLRLVVFGIRASTDPWHEEPGS